MDEALDDKPSIVNEWLESEAAESPDCQVLASLRRATKSGKLDEDTLMTNLRGLVAEPSLPERDVST